MPPISLGGLADPDAVRARLRHLDVGVALAEPAHDLVAVGAKLLGVEQIHRRVIEVLIRQRAVYDEQHGERVGQIVKQLPALPPDLRNRLTIGIYDKSPASAWLVKHGMEAQAKPYQMLSPDPDQYPGSIIDKDLAQGKIDAAIVWGPVGSYYAKRVTSVALTVIPLKSEPGVKFDYEIAMGVRYGEPEWKTTVEKLIAENKAAITAINH